MAKIKITTKPEYKQGYEAADANQPRKSPYRVGTAREEMWLAGYDAFVNGGKTPETPRKRRTKVEMAEARANPMVATDFNTPSKPLPTSLVIKPKEERKLPVGPRGPGLLEKLVETQKQIATETDPELLELLHMDLADLEWTIFVLDGPKPSTRWEEYKREHRLDFERTAA